MAKFHFFVLEDSRGFYETDSPTKFRKVDIFMKTSSKTSNFVELDGQKDKNQTTKENKKFQTLKTGRTKVEGAL